MYWFVFCKGDLLLSADSRVPSGEEPPVHLDPWHTVLCLPELEGEPCRAVSIDAPVVSAGWKMVGLRDTFDVLPRHFYEMAGKAAELIYWDSTSRYCGVCGSPMKFHTDISKRCTACGKEVWPQLAVAIIVAVTRNDGQEILLVQARNFRGNYYGLVAGFVETGETLEDCVRREVREETGIEVKNVEYWGSQSWPYPCGLMAGFKAEYAGGRLHLQHAELCRGGWFTRDALPPIPGKVSLARQLIDDWLDRQARKK